MGALEFVLGALYLVLSGICLLLSASDFPVSYGIVLRPRRGSIIGNAAVLKTAARKGLQVRVLSPPPSFKPAFFRTKSPRHILV